MQPVAVLSTFHNYKGKDTQPRICDT